MDREDRIEKTTAAELLSEGARADVIVVVKAENNGVAHGENRVCGVEEVTVEKSERVRGVSIGCTLVSEVSKVLGPD